MEGIYAGDEVGATQKNGEILSLITNVRVQIFQLNKTLTKLAWLLTKNEPSGAKESEIRVLKTKRPQAGQQEVKSLERVKLDHVLVVLEKTGGNKKEACKLLKVSRNTLKAYLQITGTK